MEKQRFEQKEILPINGFGAVFLITAAWLLTLYLVFYVCNKFSHFILYHLSHPGFLHTVFLQRTENCKTK